MTVRPQARLLILVAASALVAACGKKGPPLPPLVLLPQPPAELTAVRRAEQVDLTFRVPKANVDRSTPASIERVDLYAWTVPAPVDPAEVVRRGLRVGSVAVNKPVDPDAPEPKTPAPRGPGVEQDAVATVTDTLPAGADPTSYRAYVAVGVSPRGRRGALSPRVAVPLVSPPPAMAAPDVTYDEKGVTLAWPAADTDPSAPAYRSIVRVPGAGGAVLTPAPIAEATFVDTPITWDTERCYELRRVLTVENVRIESAPSPARCVTPRDTFPPAPPQGLVGVGAEGAISLIWNPNQEPDLAGYVVLRAVAPSTQMVPITAAPISDTNFRDTVPGGSLVTYAVQAVDRAGNRSTASDSITESAR